MHNIGFSLRSCTKDMTITIVITNPGRKWGWSVDDVMPRRDGLRIWKILKKIHLRSDHDVEKLRSDYGVEKLRSDHGVEKLKSDHGVKKLVSDHGVEKLRSDQAVEDLRLDHAGRQLSFCHWGRELSSLPLSWVFYRCSSG